MIVDGGFGLPGSFNIHKHFDPGQCVLVLNHYFLAQEALHVQWQAVLSFWRRLSFVQKVGTLRIILTLLVFSSITIVNKSDVDHLLNISAHRSFLSLL